MVSTEKTHWIPVSSFKTCYPELLRKRKRAEVKFTGELICTPIVQRAQIYGIIRG